MYGDLSGGTQTEQTGATAAETTQTGAATDAGTGGAQTEQTGAAGTSTATETQTGTPTGQTATQSPAAPELPADIKARLARLDQLEHFAPIADQLKAEGFTDAASVERRLLVQRETQNREQAAQQRLQGRIDAGDITPDQAQALYEQEATIIAREVQADALLNQYSAAQRQTELSSLLTTYPDTLGAGGQEARDLLNVLAQATGRPMNEVGTFVHNLLTGASTRAVTAYAAKNPAGAPAPQGGGAGSPAPMQPAGNVNSSWSELFGFNK